MKLPDNWYTNNTTKEFRSVIAHLEKLGCESIGFYTEYSQIMYKPPFADGLKFIRVETSEAKVRPNEITWVILPNDDTTYRMDIYRGKEFSSSVTIDKVE